MKNKVLLLIAAVGLSACSATDILLGEDNTVPARDLPVLQQGQVNTTVLWRTDIGNLGQSAGLALSPVSDGQNIYALNKRGRLLALNANTGNSIYSHELEQDITAGLAAGDGMLFAVNRNGDALAMDAASGNLRWRIPLGVRVLANPTYHQGMLVIRSIDGGIFALDAARGEKLWKYQISEPIINVRGNASAVVGAGVVIVTTDNGRIFVLDQKTGLPLADQQISTGNGLNDIQRLADLDATPLVNGDVLFASAFQTATYAMDLTQGRILWTQPKASAVYDFAMSPSALFMQNKQGHVQALSQQNGSLLWDNDDVEGRGASSVIAIPGRIGVVDKDGFLHWFDESSGKLIGQIQVGKAGMVAKPLILSDRIILTLLDGTILAIRPQ